MNARTLSMLAVCTGLAALPAAALAAPTPAPAMEATMMCRMAMSGEKTNAMMGTKPMVCKAMPKMDSKMGPDTTGMDANAAAAAWRQWLMNEMIVPMSPFGSG
jgi:hypothetical protein